MVITGIGHSTKTQPRLWGVLKHPQAIPIATEEEGMLVCLLVLGNIWQFYLRRRWVPPKTMCLSFLVTYPGTLWPAHTTGWHVHQFRSDLLPQANFLEIKNKQTPDSQGCLFKIKLIILLMLCHTGGTDQMPGSNTVHNWPAHSTSRRRNKLSPSAKLSQATLGV